MNAESAIDAGSRGKRQAQDREKSATPFSCFNPLVVWCRNDREINSRVPALRCRPICSNSTLENRFPNRYRNTIVRRVFPRKGSLCALYSQKGGYNPRKGSSTPERGQGRALISERGQPHLITSEKVPQQGFISEKVDPTSERGQELEFISERGQYQGLSQEGG